MRTKLAACLNRRNLTSRRVLKLACSNPIGYPTECERFRKYALPNCLIEFQKQVSIGAIRNDYLDKTRGGTYPVFDEPGEVDSNKKMPAHRLRKIQKVERPPKRHPPRENNTVVVGMVGMNTVLKCDVELSNVTVIWVKHETNNNVNSVNVLTVDNNTLVDDKRFLAVNENNSRIWVLHVRYTKPSDAGLYECQVCNSPTFSIYVRLELFEARAVILGPNIKEVDKGFPIRLSCILNSTAQYRIKKKPTYMFWYHDDRMINYDLKDGAVVREGRLGTELIFQRALPTHAGNYSCVPSNAQQASVRVIVHYQGEPSTTSALSSESENAAASTNYHMELMALLLFAVIVY